MSIDSYKTTLLNAEIKKLESVFQKIADDFEDDLLNFDNFPYEHFAFIIQLLSDARFYKKPGVWNFLLVIGTEGHKLTDKNYKELSRAITENYEDYTNEDLCLSVCDFIARNYEYETAKNLLLLLVKKEARMEEKGFAYDGLRILELEKQRNEN